MSSLIAALYILCILFLTGFGLFVIAKNPKALLNRYFALLCLALLGWVGSLFAFVLQTSAAELLWLGRFNFAAVALVAPLAYLFVRELAGRPPARKGWMWAESAALAAATLLSASVDRAELVSGGLHTTSYGSLFPLYVLHVLAYVGAALFAAFRPLMRTLRDRRSQLALVGWGILGTFVIALVTNAILPYAFGDFRFIHLGTISTILFIAAVGYATFVEHLFDVRVVIRATLVFAGLIALALEVYHATIGFLVHLLPLGGESERNFAATMVTLVVYSFTQTSVQKWLERIVRRAFLRNPRT